MSYEIRTVDEQPDGGIGFIVCELGPKPARLSDKAYPSALEAFKAAQKAKVIPKECRFENGLIVRFDKEAKPIPEADVVAEPSTEEETETE